MLIVGKTRPAAEESAHLSTAEARWQSPPLPDWLGRAWRFLTVFYIFAVQIVLLRRVFFYFCLFYWQSWKVDDGRLCFLIRFSCSSGFVLFIAIPAGGKPTFCFFFFAGNSINIYNIWQKLFCIKAWSIFRLHWTNFLRTNPKAKQILHNFDKYLLRKNHPKWQFKSSKLRHGSIPTWSYLASHVRHVTRSHVSKGGFASIFEGKAEFIRPLGRHSKGDWLYWIACRLAAKFCYDVIQAD